MKKLLISCMVGLLALAGCSSGGGDTTSDEQVLKIAGLEGGYGKAGWEAVAKKFEEENPGVKVELQLEKNISDVLRPVIQSKEGIPDIIYLAVGSTGGLTDTMIAEKQIVKINDVLDLKAGSEDKTVGEKILPGFTDALTSKPYGDGDMYLMPINYSPCGLFYNAGLFKEKGWDVPTSWDEMWALGDKAQAEGIALFTYPTTGYFDAFFSALLNTLVGPEVYTKLMNYDEEAWQSPEVKEAFEIVGKLAQYTEKNTVANANDKDFSKNQQLVLDNKALFIPNGTWLPGEMKDAPRADGFEWGFMAVPAAKAGGDEYSTTFVEQMYIPEGAANVDLAKKFMASMYADDTAKVFYEQGTTVMPIVGASSFMADDDENKLYYEIYDGGAKANAVGFAALKNQVNGIDLTGANGILYGTVNSVVSGDKTVDEWYNTFLENLKTVNEANK